MKCDNIVLTFKRKDYGSINCKNRQFKGFQIK